ncbi:MAG: hypothetical protein R3Y38_00790 [Rikenellaceae bacterium]
MFGIRKKITTGFVSLAIILFFSGVISLLELSSLSSSTTALLDKSKQNMETAKQMLDAVQNQNTALLQMVITGTSEQDSVYLAEVENFEIALKKASLTVRDLEALNDIYIARESYNILIDNNIDKIEQTDKQWFVNIYKTNYYNLTSAIKNYMIQSQEDLAGDAVSLESKAHRAITPGILALGVGILILLMFLFFINTYLVGPVVAMQKSLKAFINAKIPFQVKMQGQDEVAELKENIEELVNKCKNKRA